MDLLGFKEAYDAFTPAFKAALTFEEAQGSRNLLRCWYRTVGARVGEKLGLGGFIISQADGLYVAIPSHFLSVTCRYLREFLDRDGADQELAPLYLIQIELDAADFSSNPPAGPVPPDLVLPPIANFQDNAPSVPPPPPAAPPITSETGITAETVTFSAIIGRGSSGFTTFEALRLPDLPIVLFGDVSGAALGVAGERRPPWEFKGTDRNLLERLQKVLSGMLVRDGLAQDWEPTRKISTRDLFFDADEDLEAVQLLLARVSFLLGIQKV